MRALRLILLSSALTMAVPPAEAQEASHGGADGLSTLTLAPGDTIRVSRSGLARTEGVLIALDSASMQVRVPGRDATVSIPRAAIAEIEVLRGHPRRGVAAAVTGLFGGAVAGAVLGGLMTRGSYPNHEEDGLWIMMTSIAGAAVGTVGGAVMAFTRTDRWIPVDPNSLSLLETP